MAPPPGPGTVRGAMPDERRSLEMDDGVRIAVNLHFPDTPPPWTVLMGPELAAALTTERRMFA